MVTTNNDVTDPQVFDPASATEAEIAAAANLWNRVRQERLPEDPPSTPTEIRARLSSIPPFVDHTFWVVWDSAKTKMLAYALAMSLHTGDNAHIVQFELAVLPEWRRHGIGSTLLGKIATVASEQNKRLLITTSWGNVPAGAAFLGRIGATVGMESHMNQLDLADLDRAMIERWVAEAEARNPDIELGLWIGPYPEDEIVAIAKLIESGNEAPTENMDIEDFHWTPEQLRAQEEGMRIEGTERWTMYVRDLNSGEFAGFTEVFWNPSKPAVLQQGLTAVWPQYRNRSLGRWLKAAMLQKALAERSQLQVVRTENANSNAPMLKINQELGFKPHSSESMWQVEREKVEAYLTEKLG